MKGERSFPGLTRWAEPRGGALLYAAAAHKAANPTCHEESRGGCGRGGGGFAKSTQ